MYAIVFLQGFVFYGPVATLFRQARGLSMSEIFLIESISWVLMIILEIPWGWISDKFGYKKTHIAVNVLLFLSKIVFYGAYSFESFLVERLMLSVALSGLSGCDTALIYASIRKTDTQKAFGRYSAFGTLGFLIASILSSFIVTVSIDHTALLTIFPYGISALLTFFLDEVKSATTENFNIYSNFKHAFEDKSIILFIFSIALVMEVVQAVTVFLNQAQYLKCGIDPKYFGLIVAGIQCARLLSVKANVISKKIGNIKSIGMLIAVIIVSCTLLMVTTHAFMSVTCVVIIALSMSVIGPIELDIKNKMIKGSDRATLLSIYSMVGGLIASLSNIIVGKAADYSLQTGLLICVLMSLMSFVLLNIYSKKKNA